ncbi:MAG: hypothetical protein LBD51_02105 [Bifidobacteriaceae bacterium]|jgi:hypothetical protein|nr:hypothetical protein [Bifidobacteriaceae bacterium]
MDWTGPVLIALSGAAGIVLAVWLAASRVDRLHRRVDLAWAALRLQLTRRASTALLLARLGLWQPAAARAVEAAARAALDARPGGPEHSELSAALRAAAGDRAQIERHLAHPQCGDLVRDLGAVWYRAILARRFLNDAVALARRLRRRRLVRLFRLAGRTPLPLPCDIDDAPPDGLLAA